MTNEQIGELIIKTLLVRMAIISLHVNVKTPFYLLSRYSRAKIHFLSKFRMPSHCPTACYALDFTIAIFYCARTIITSR